MPSFSHLHVHTQFSLLDGAADISKLYKKAISDNMNALAITDHGNMFGVFKFVAEAYKHKLNPDDKDDKRLKVKPIVGCEFYVVEDRHKKQFTKDNKDIRCHQVLRAKNAEGYKNLSKLCSLGYIEGLYSKWPRIDKELIVKYHKGLIATTCCIGAEVPRTILRKGEEEGEKVFKWWLDVFGEDYYIELQRHNLEEQDKVNEVLLRFAEKYNVKIIASNDSHYVDQQDANAHDILLCVNTGDIQSTPKATDEEGGKGYRFGFPNNNFYFKTQGEMSQVFSDLPHALDNTGEIVDKVELLKLERDILVPNFPIPEGFIDGDDYLRHLTFEGAKNRYKDISPEIEERLNFELLTIRTMGFPGYFLIVADFIKAGREMGVFIGPGRGSAAGSAVAYCIGITNIDPIKYELLFERFLNPSRKSMPDIDTDFDDVGREKVLDYVIKKYGKNQVAQIINYGTMAAKSAIKDVARALDLQLAEANALVKHVPDKPGTTLQETFNTVDELKTILKGNDLRAKVLQEALKLEGSVRNTGIHASAVIIAPSDLLEYIPLSVAKDSELWVTQFDGKVIENAGLLKMDFLGLKTLTIIKDALQLIEQNHGVKIDIDSVPLDDKKTFELFQKGNTIAVFQFEAPHVPPILRDMKPSAFEDLIALNALNRPGPAAYIPKYIARKHGKEKIAYDLPEMEELLKETYGITVYQEQVMLLSQKLAGFSKGDADNLRKAMGKKLRAKLDEMKEQFVEGCEKNGHDKKVVEKIWTDWEAFAEYAFNKSHSTCYAFVAFQTAYLKAHYPAEFMASVLTHNLENIDKVTFFIDESRRMGIPVLGPDINESDYRFAVNKKGEIRFGLGAVKGVGEAAVAAIVDERKANGPFKNIFDLVKRINLRTANKKTFESLTYGGGFDSFGLHRANYFATEGDGNSFIEKVLRYGANSQEAKNSSQVSLFGEASEVQIPEPTVPVMEPWGTLEQLKYEKDVVGFYLSGHPLDSYRLEMKFCKQLSELREILNIRDKELLAKMKDKEMAFGGMITAVNHRQSKNGNPFGNFTLEDYNDSTEFVLFGKDYVQFKPFLEPGFFVFVRGRMVPSYRNPDTMEFKITSMQLLSEVRSKMLKSITIKILLSDISDEFIGRLSQLLDENSKKTKGTCAVKFNVIDPDENLSVELPSRKIKITPDNELIEAIEEQMSLKCKWN